MKLVDLNLLLYAINRDSPRHQPAVKWLDSALDGPETVALPWVVLLGFLRLTTRSGIFTNPLTVEEASGVLDDWLERPNVSIVRPGDEHWRILRTLLQDCGTAGNLTTDAHLAALAIEYDACLCSTDHDFARFGSKLRYLNPIS